MTIKRIAELSKEEINSSKTITTTLYDETHTPDESKMNLYILEIISSYNPMNPNEGQKVFSSIAIYTTTGTMIHHEVYTDTITPNQMREAEMNIKNNIKLYIKTEPVINQN